MTFCTRCQVFSSELGIEVMLSCSFALFNGLLMEVITAVSVGSNLQLAPSGGVKASSHPTLRHHSPGSP